VKIVRFKYKKKEYWGILNKDSKINVLKSEPYQKIIRSSHTLSLNKVKLLAPATPSKIILVGLNYKKHASELNMEIPREPIIFLKPTTALANPDENIKYPKTSKRVDYEGELAIVIRKKARDVKIKDVKKYILGYTCLNDVTARDIQHKDAQWSRAKSFDTFCPLGPLVETSLDPCDLRVRTYLNGKLKQDSSTRDFIFTIDKVVSFISKVMTLLPGDIISTGTPSGVGPMRKNDIIEVEIEGIGKLTNRVA
jgi:2-keto-4-pentenoate hydratase/2-oxohepta-3-ene-1,7-dioic acid hydratase in catechol pathway